MTGSNLQYALRALTCLSAHDKIIRERYMYIIKYIKYAIITKLHWNIYKYKFVYIYKVYTHTHTYTYIHTHTYNL